MRRTALLAAAALLAACDSDPVRPDPPPPAVELTAVVNVQLYQKEAGTVPEYIVTGQVRASQGGVDVPAIIDSVTVGYRRGSSDWIRVRRTSSFPFSGNLPFTPVAGEEYGVRGRVYGRAVSAQGATVRAENEWIATTRGL